MVRKWSSGQAQRFPVCIASSLGAIPLQYRGLFTGFYSVNYKKYKAFYRVREGYIEVIRIIMAKRDYMTILFGEPEEVLDETEVHI